MKGLFKRDCYLLLPVGRLYGIIMLVMMVFSVISKSYFLLMYAVIYGLSAVTTLFSYDESNRWKGYAAALPNGRRDQVLARYRTALLMTCGIAALCLVTALISWAFRGEKSTLGMVFLCAGITLLINAVEMPILYRFGLNKGKVMAIVVMALSVGIVTGLGAILQISDQAGGLTGGVGLGLVAAGVLALYLSRGISLKIVAKQDL